MYFARPTIAVAKMKDHSQSNKSIKTLLLFRTFALKTQPTLLECFHKLLKDHSQSKSIKTLLLFRTFALKTQPTLLECFHKLLKTLAKIFFNSAAPTPPPPPPHTHTPRHTILSFTRLFAFASLLNIAQNTLFILLTR